MSIPDPDTTLFWSRPVRGAWIETDLQIIDPDEIKSRAPYGARGLKR